MDVVDQVRNALQCLPAGLGLQDVVVGLGVVVRPRPADPSAGLQYLHNYHYTHRINTDKTDIGNLHIRPIAEQNAKCGIKF